MGIEIPNSSRSWLITDLLTTPSTQSLMRMSKRKIPSESRRLLLQFYSNKFSETVSSRPTLLGAFPNVLSADEAAKLEIPFNLDEITSALKSCNSSKAPGPDGFNFKFIKEAWKFIQEDVIQFFLEFHSNGRLVSSLNSTFIGLIPKRAGASEFKDFRPISLVGYFYKLLAKTLSARLKSVMSRVIGASQAAFMGVRQIMDAILIANETIHWWKSSNKPGIILKLDFEKAFNSVNWEFILHILRKMGFGSKWISWIRSCISSTTVSVLINGSPSKQLKPSRGLR